MPKIHVARPGEHLGLIAKKHGFVSSRRVHEVPANARLWQEGLKPGDTVVIPDKRLKTVTRRTGEKHEFELRRTTYAEVVLLEEKTLAPARGVKLDFLLPGEQRVALTTDDQGRAYVDGIEPGTYEVSCDLSGARLSRTIGAPGSGGGGAGGAAKGAPAAGDAPPEAIDARWIALVEPRSLKPEEAIEDVARSANMPAAALIDFNEGFLDVDLPWTVVDGPDMPEPEPAGERTVYIPKPFRRSGLACEKREVIHYRLVPDPTPLKIHLVDRFGEPLADTDYRISWAGGERKGTTDKDGNIEEPGLGGRQVYLSLGGGLLAVFGHDLEPYEHDAVAGITDPDAAPAQREWALLDDERSEPGSMDELYAWDDAGEDGEPGEGEALA